MYQHTPHNRRGFTLIEIIVSLGIFAIVATVALGALVKIVSANKKAQTIQTAITNINFSLDALSREMRVGRNYYCAAGSSFNLSTLPEGNYLDSTSQGGTKCPNGYSSATDSDGRVIAFTSTKSGDNGLCNLIYAYRFYENQDGTYSLEKAEQSGCDQSAYVFQSIVDPNVTITGYYVRVVASDVSPFPRATILISGYAGLIEKEKTYFDVQTTVSSRVQ
jgi:prepilin-type N-terminal cleavage/methylation domain-containing protein